MEKRKNFLLNTAFIVTVFGIWFFTIKLLSGVLLPFLLAVLTVVALRKATSFVSCKLRLKNNVTAVIIVVLFYLLILSAVAFLLFFLFREFNEVVDRLPQFIEKLSVALKGIGERFDSLIGRMPDSTVGIFGQVPEIAVGSLTEWLTGFATSFAGNLVSAIPIFLLSLLVTVVASIYFAKDYDGIRDLSIRTFSAEGLKRIVEFKGVCLGNLWKLVKGYCIILGVTFVELVLSFSILGFKYSLTLALVISVVDILPVLGCGTVLIPWAAVSAIGGDLENAIGLSVIYLIITAVRHIIEPKIIGSSVGIHPILMLFSVVVGLKLFGVVGVVAVPMTVIVLKELPWHPKSQKGEEKI